MPHAGFDDESTLLETFYKKLTLTDLKSIGFQFYTDPKGRTTTLRNKTPFLWAYPDVLAECLYKEQLLDSLEKCGFDGKFFTVIANGVLHESDVFPFAIFQVTTAAKPIAKSESNCQEPREATAQAVNKPSIV